MTIGQSAWCVAGTCIHCHPPHRGGLGAKSSSWKWSPIFHDLTLWLLTFYNNRRTKHPDNCCLSHPFLTLLRVSFSSLAMGLEGFKQKLKLGRFKPKTTPTAAHDGAGPSGNGQVPGPNTRASEAPADQDHQSPGPSKPAFDARPISELWDIAFDKLGEEEGELIQRYKTELLCPGSVTEALGLTIGTKANRRELVDALLKRKIEEVQRDAWKLKFSTSSEVPVKDLAQPVLSMVGWANDYITEAASGNAYASIAWFGVSLLLPVRTMPRGPTLRA